MGVFGSNFGHTVTQTLPVLAAQLAQGASQEVPGVHLGAGTANLHFPRNSCQWIAARSRAKLLPESAVQCWQRTKYAALRAAAYPSNHPAPANPGCLERHGATSGYQHDLIEVAYIGNKGTHVFAGDGPTYNVNNPSMVGYCANAACSASLRHLSCTVAPTTTILLTLAIRIMTNIQADLPAPGPAPRLVPGVLQCCSTDQGNYLGNDASSKYDALQIKVEKRFSHGLQVLSHYTFAHAYKYDNAYYPDDPAVAYGPDDQVRNQVWVNNVVYELPFGKERRLPAIPAEPKT